MILRFAVENFRCFADRVELDLATRQFRTKVPRAGQTWPELAQPVAAVLGPNASGKSTVLEAIRALAQAVRRPGASSIYQPYRGEMDDDCSTSFEVGFVAKGKRYEYRVEACPWGIRRESLDEYVTSRPRRLFEREQLTKQAEMTFVKGASLTGPTQEVRKLTGRTKLFLAVALQYEHDLLAPVARALALDGGVGFVSFRDMTDEVAVQRVVLEMAAAPDEQGDLVGALLRAADLGIDSIDVREETLPQPVRQKVRRLLEALNDGEVPDDDEVPELVERVTFQHRGRNGARFDLRIAQESSGTLTWLGMAWHALRALAVGSVLLVDELDASLHPELVRYLVELFVTPQTNPLGGQLIFTTHDVTLLGNVPTRALQPDQAWFTQKGEGGCSELYSLADFDDLRPGSNAERQYRAGRFGAVPDIDEGLVLRFLAAARSRTA